MRVHAFEFISIFIIYEEGHSTDVMPKPHCHLISNLIRSQYLVLTLTGMLGGALLNGQGNIIVHPDIIEEVYLNIDISTLDFIPMQSLIANTTQDTLELGWIRVINMDCPAEWVFAVSDRNITYIPSISISPLPIILPSLVQDEPITLELYPMNTPGCGTASLILNYFDEPNMHVDTITYTIQINEPVCGTSGMDNSSVRYAIVAVTPQPVHNEFSLTDTEGYDRIDIYNMMGNLIQVIDASARNTYDVSNLAAGIYTLRLLNGNHTVGVSLLVIA